MFEFLRFRFLLFVSFYKKVNVTVDTCYNYRQRFRAWGSGGNCILSAEI